MKRIVIATLGSFMAILGSAAQAQVALDNGASLSISTSQTVGSGITYMDFGTAGYTGASPVLLSRMPMSLTYADASVNITFSGSSGLYSGGAYAPSAMNYLTTTSAGSVTLDFSQAQTFFSTRWSTQDLGNQFSFYNGDQLIASATGADVRPLTIALTGTSTSVVDFNFAQLGYDRIVVTASGAGYTEFGAIGFGRDVQVAPIPLNAASMGGLMSFLMMLGMWGKGGTRRMLRMTFASITPRRRVLA